ncbi:SDR family oxidoreductase [Streptomyces roseifaciens]|uniref:SDR family oxidoreductase n=1 Tax=Streptomyces roseifaciens TaxID=1488406 RepID=UPI00071811BA|nr:SDR family oxidoreductase [Streptomyces roseifaciens]
MTLEGKRVLITGASGDLGKAMAHTFLGLGADLALQYRSNSSPIDLLLKEAEKRGREAFSVAVDLAEPDGADRLASEVLRRWPSLDGLVNNAGGARPQPFDEITPDAWERALHLNLTSPFRLLQLLLPALRKQGGSVVNISSVAALTGGAFGPQYAASKAGLLGLTRSAARDLGRYGIRVNAIAPGPVESAMTSSLDGPVLDGIIGATALRRLVDPREIAETAAFLLGPGSAVSGQTLVVDAGRHFI